VFLLLGSNRRHLLRLVPRRVLFFMPRPLPLRIRPVAQSIAVDQAPNTEMRLDLLIVVQRLTADP